jgi:two-component system, sensor histidine kinase and response regulator
VTSELDRLRTRFGQFLIVLLWAHVPLVALVATATHRPLAPPALIAILLAGSYNLAWWRHGIASATRYVSAVALMGQPAILVYLLAGHPWQMDMHMYFFATLALTIAWCDWRVILVAASAIAVHHVLFDLVLPYAVFPRGADLARVLLHAAIVAFQAAVLVWLSKTLADSFERIGSMSNEIMRHNETLEQKVLERTQEAETANRAKSLFLANMSHEIRTPMNAVLGFCHLALRTELTPKQQDYLSKIQNASRSLLGLINNILDFSKIEAGKLSLERVNFNPRAVLESSVSIAAVKAVEKGIAVSLNVDATVPATVMGDAHQLNQVLLNLISNAIKFTQNGSVTVSVRMLEQHGPAVTLSFSVRDTGIGLTAQQQALLFRPFSQADDSTTRQFGGTGLGLAISKQIIELMGGTIAVESVPGVGSNFTFTVMMQIGEVEQVSLRISPEALKLLRVLIADDNPASLEILQDIFVLWAMPVDLVSSGKEALAALEIARTAGAPYDLMLVDLKMPGMDGIETVRAMHASPVLAPLPAVIMVSAYGQGDAKAEAELSGVSAFLLKPIDPATLLETIAALFGPDRSRVTARPAPAGSIPIVAAHLRGMRVLVVEDNEINREVAVELLTDAGLTTDIAENGRIACERVLESGERYDAILMDMQMPVMDGLEATTRIRQRWPSDRLPIIAMTAHASETERRRCLEAGMNDHIAKPVDPTLLIHTLGLWLKPHAAAVSGSPDPATQSIAPPSASELPANLPPFDLDAALVRTNGKRPLLRRLIVSFGDTFAVVVPTLRRQIAEASLVEARHLAHTLKGAAGALEIRAVAKAAGEIEDAVAIGNLASLATLLDCLEQEILPALAAAGSLKGASAPPLAPVVGIDYGSSTRVIAELRGLLERRNLRARNVFDQMEQALGTTPEAAALLPIKVALGRLDYGAALTMLENITGPTERRIRRDRRADVSQ